MVKSRSGPFLTPQKLPSNGSTGSETPFSEASSGKNQPQSSLKSASNGSTAPKTAFKPASNRPGGVKNPFQEASNGSSKPRSSLKLPSNGSPPQNGVQAGVERLDGFSKPFFRGVGPCGRSPSGRPPSGEMVRRVPWKPAAPNNAIYFPQPRARPDGLPLVFSRLPHQAD